MYGIILCDTYRMAFVAPGVCCAWFECLVITKWVGFFITKWAHITKWVVLYYKMGTYYEMGRFFVVVFYYKMGNYYKMGLNRCHSFTSHLLRFFFTFDQRKTPVSTSSILSILINTHVYVIYARLILWKSVKRNKQISGGQGSLPHCPFPIAQPS